MENLTVTNLSHKFRDGNKYKVVLENINAEFLPGKLYAILGYSGSGKTTLISFLSGLDTPNQGIIKYDGNNINDMGLREYRNSKSSIVFQRYNLIEYQTAYQNIMTTFGIANNGLPKDSKKIAYNLLDFVGISQSKAIRKVSKLSGGEQQRVAIARALSTNSEVIFADEPTGNLDSDTEREIIKLFKTLAVEYNKCVIIVTHSDEVAKSADVVMKISNGRLDYE